METGKLCCNIRVTKMDSCLKFDRILKSLSTQKECRVRHFLSSPTAWLASTSLQLDYAHINEINQNI